MIVIPWFNRALIAAGFESGWSTSGEEITRWENPEPQPTIAELEAILPRD